MRTILTATALFTALTLSTPVNADNRKIVYIQPLGAQITTEEITATASKLESVYDIKTIILNRIPPPRSAYYEPLNRYSGDDILKHLESIMPADGWKIMGVTGVDISTPAHGTKYWRVMGLGLLDGSAAIISTSRCKLKAKSREQALDRFVKTAVHEFGHNMGLDHCPTHGCLMHDMEGKVTTADSENSLCPRCATRLGTILKSAQ